MKLVKKIIKKLYHLIWFLSIFFVFSSPVYAVVNIGGTAFEQSPQVNFYDNTNGSLTSAGSSFYTSQGYWVSDNNIITNGTWVNGANIALTVNTTFVAGYTYSLSLLIGMEFTSVHGSTPRVCIAENINNAVTRFQDPNFSCTNAFSTVAMSGVANFDYNGYSLSYGMVTYVFTADFTSPTITVVYQSNGGANNSRHIFGGYHLETIAQPNNGLTQSQVQSIINNSGLASANSVSQVQQSINQIQTDINSSANNIINNNEQNTQDIINNQNDNTNKEIDSQKVCKNIDKSSAPNKSFLNANGQLSNSTSSVTTNFFSINSSTTLKVLQVASSGTYRTCFYDINKNFISCLTNSDLVVNSNVSFPTGSAYFRSTISVSENKPTFEYCQSGNQALNDSVNDLNDSITNDDAPDLDLSLNESSDTPISDLLTMPLTILNTLITNLSDTCSNYTIPFFFSTTVTFPCFTLSDYLGTTVTNYIDLFICLYMCYNIAMLCVSVFDDITSLNDIFNSLYTPRHAYTGYKPKHGGD